MVSYSLDGVTRRATIFRVVAAALFIAFLINGFVELTGLDAKLIDLIREKCSCDKLLDISIKLLGPFSLDFLALTGFIVASMFYVFNKYLWKMKSFSSTLNIPDLNGVWVGTISRQEFPSGKTEVNVPIKISIQQTFSLMSFVLENSVMTSMSQQTKSVSKIIGVSGDSNAGFMLREGFNFKDTDTGKEIFGTTIWTVEEDGLGTFMTGEYVSGFPRTGNLKVRRVARNQDCLCGKIRRLEDNDGNKYLGVIVNRDDGNKYLKLLENKKGRAAVSEWNLNRKKRDGADYHLTVVSPSEFKGLTKEQITAIMEDDVTYVLKYLGRTSNQKDPDAYAYYVITSSPHIDYIRTKVGLSKRDLHVTLGFENKDVYDDVKDDGTRIN